MEISKINSNLFFDYRNQVSINNANVIKLNSIGFRSFKDNGPKRNPPLHSHSFFEIHISLREYISYQLEDGSIVKLKKNQYVLFPKKIPHKFFEWPANHLKFSCSFDFSYQDINQFTDNENFIKLLDYMNSLQKPIIETLSETAQKYIKQIHDTNEVNNPFIHTIYKNLTTNLILDILSPLYNQKRINIKFNNNEKFAIAVQYIRDNIYSSISVDDVAKKVYISARQLDRIFMKNTSMSVTNFILNQKYDEAKTLLMLTSMPIYVIGEKLGFCAPSHFNSFFKKHSNCTPNQFRTRYNQTQASSQARKVRKNPPNRS